MKTNSLLFVALAALAKASEQAAEPFVIRGDRICVDSNKGEYCYPKVFEPLDAWQDVLPGQELPGGLHVRINVDTGRKEAKFVDKEDSTSNEVQVVAPADKKAAEKRDHKDDLPEQIEEVDETPESDDDLQLREQIRQSADYGHLSQLSESLENLQKYQKLDKRTLVHTLETLSDLGHEVDFGARIAQDASENLIKIIESPAVSDDLKEIAAQALGASLRNNPAAMKKVAGPEVVKTMLEQVEKSKDHKLTSRLVYAVGSIVSNGEADKSIYLPFDNEFLNSHGGEIFRRAFQDGNNDVKRKISTFVYDRGLRLVWPDTELNEWSDLFQHALIKDSIDKDTKFSVFQTLTELHEYMGEWNPSDALPNERVKRSTAEMLPVRDDFLQWLSNETENYRYKRLADEEEQEYQSLLLRVRHSVYGNRMAGRKVY